jgi:MFS family permease
MTITHATLRHNRNFVLLLTSATVSAFGTWVSYIALNLFAYSISKSWSSLAVTMSVSLVPSMFSGPIAGVLADRLDRRKLMIAIDAGRCLLFLILPLASQPWHVYVIAFTSALGSQFYVPASQAVVPTVVDRGQLLRANSLLSLGAAIMPMLGPAIGGALTANSGPAAAFLVNAWSFAFSAGCLCFCRFPPVAAVPGRHGARVWSDIIDGCRLIGANAVLSAVLVPRLLEGVGCGMFNVLYPVAASGFNGSGTAYGLLVSAWGAGTVIGSALTARAGGRLNPLRLYPIAIAWQGLFLGGSIMCPNLPSAMSVILIGGIGDAATTVILLTLVGQLCGDAVRGRVFGLLNALTCTALSAGMIAAGCGVPRVPFRGLAAVGMIAVVIGGAAAVRVTRAAAAHSTVRPAGIDG